MQGPNELGLHERLLSSARRTTDPDEADFFYVPTWGQVCAILFLKECVVRRIVQTIEILGLNWIQWSALSAYPGGGWSFLFTGQEQKALILGFLQDAPKD